MTIYFIEGREHLGNVQDQINPLAETVLLTPHSTDINAYHELFTDSSDKILAIAPGKTDWKIPNDVIDKIPNLKAICTKSAWAFYIDINHCEEKEIVITNCPGGNSQSVAEYAVWQMFSLARKLPLQMSENFKIAWDGPHEQTELMGKTVGILGLGNIGSRIAKLTQGLGMQVVYWSHTSRNAAYAYLPVEDVLSQSDVLFICTEVCAETKGFLGAAKLNLLKPASFVVSVLGGPGFGVVDDNHLIQMVKDNKLAGYSVENEPEHGYTLPDIAGHNIFMPGAYAWYTVEARHRTNHIWADSIKGVISGNIINQVKA